MLDALNKLKIALRLDQPLRLVWSSARGWTLANLVIVALLGLLPLLSLYLIKQIVDIVASSLSVVDKGPALQHALVWIILIGITNLATALCGSLAQLANEAQSLAVTDHVADLLHAKSVEVDLEYYEDARYHDTLHRAQQEAPFRPTQIVTGLVQIGQALLSLVGIAAILFSLNWLLAVLLVFIALPGAAVHLYYSRKLFKFEQEQTKNERKAWYYHWMLTDADHAKEVRLFSLGDAFRARHRDLRKLLRDGRLALTRRRALLDVLVQGLVSLTIFATLAVVAIQAIQGTIALGSLVLYYQGFQLGLGALQTILNGLVTLYENNLFLSNMYEFLGIEPRVKAPVRPVAVPFGNRDGLVFHTVGFSYPSNDRRVLQDIDIRLSPGEVIALVGENGAGKTTLIKLLCRLYDPTNGGITFDDIDIREFDPVAWRRRIGVVFQDFMHYQLTAAENIGIGDMEKAPNMDHIIRAAQLSGADAVIRELPHGYDTLLGQWFEEGRELSIGEWQKVALARAFLREASILVLDEPTSALDPLAEAEVFRQFRKLIVGRSAILISHRFSTVQMADRIYVLQHGQVIESGTHQQLLQLNGSYARLYTIQAENYRS